jgi:hypothetical protein
MTRKRLAAALAVLAVGVGLSVPGGAAAKIAPASCTNGGGNQPGGQQPVCTGGGLTQNPATNPSGNAPPGQQP